MNTNDRAVSPVVGVILVVAITVLLSATIGALVFNMGQTSTDTPSSQQELGVRTSVEGSNVTVQIVTGGADAVSLRVNDTTVYSLTNAQPGDTLEGSANAHSTIAVVTGTGDNTNLVTAQNPFTSQSSTDATTVDNHVPEPDSAIARWTFDDADTSTNASDSWGTHHGTIQSNITYATSRQQGSHAIYLQEDSGYVDMGSPILGGNTTFTISGWVRTTNASYTQYFYAEQDDSGYGRNAIGLRNGEAFWETRNDGGGYSHIQNTSVSDGDWHHIVGVMDSNTMMLYVDGKLAGQKSAQRGPVTYSRIGLGNNYSVDDVRLYTKSLNDSEVQNLYTNNTIK